MLKRMQTSNKRRVHDKLFTIKKTQITKRKPFVLYTNLAYSIKVWKQYKARELSN